MLGDGLEVEARSKKSGLIEQVGEFCAGESGGAASDLGEIRSLGELHLLRMHAEDFLTAFDIGERDGDLTVKATGPQERGVEHVVAVRGGDDDDAFLRVEAVHLDQHGVEGLLTLIVSATETMTAMAADGVDFVDENEARGVFAALLEHVAHAAGTDADEHFDEVTATDAEEGHIGLASDGFGEEGFASSGRADHEDALGHLATEALKLFRVFEELDEFLDFLLGLLDTGDVLEGDLVAVLGEHFGAALAKAERTAAGAANLLADEEVKHRQNERERQEEAEERKVIRIMRGDHDELVSVEQFLKRLFLILDVDLDLKRTRGARGGLGSRRGDDGGLRCLRESAVRGLRSGGGCFGFVEEASLNNLTRGGIGVHEAEGLFAIDEIVFDELFELRVVQLGTAGSVAVVERAAEEEDGDAEKDEATPVELGLRVAAVAAFAVAAAKRVVGHVGMGVYGS